MKNFLRSYLQTIWHNSASVNNEILASLVESREHATILDLGCEEGSLIQERMKDKIKHPIIHGIDIDGQKVKKAKKRGIKAIKADAQKPWPYKNNFFDIVTANQLIEHLSKTDLFLEEVFRVLKPKGYLLLSTENLSSWHNIFALILGWQAFSQDISTRKPIGNPMRLIAEQKPSWALHVKIFTLKGLGEIIELHGLKVEKRFGAGYFPFPPALSRLLSSVDPIHAAFIGVRARKMATKPA